MVPREVPSAHGFNGVHRGPHVGAEETRGYARTWLGEKGMCVLTGRAQVPTWLLKHLQRGPHLRSRECADLSLS